MKRLYIAAGFKEDHLAALEKGKAKKAAYKAQQLRNATDMIDEIKESEDPIEKAFELLVPSEGPAETQAGELVRAMMKILYRDFNDGDVFYNGYGIETCGDSVAFLCDKISNLHSDFENIALRNLEGNNYTKEIEKISDKVLNYIYDNPELVTAKNTEDMYDWDGEDFIRENDWEPMYELEVSLPDNVQFHIDKGDISDPDIEEELQGRDGLQDAEISVYSDGVHIENLKKDDYDMVEHYMYQWLEQWGQELDEEYGTEEDEAEEDEE